MRDLLFLLGGAAVLPLYFLPPIVAFIRRKANRWAIFWLDLFLGWTMIGWIVMMVWALGSDAPKQAAISD